MHKETRIANYVLAAYAVISLTLLSLPLSGPVKSFKVGLTFLLNPMAFYGAKGVDRLASVPGHLHDLIAADLENRAMKEQVKSSEWVKAEAESLRSENMRLRAALGLKAPPSRVGTWAHVMERDPLRWYRGFMVDAGSEQGVTLNSAVLGQLGERLVAVGRIIEVRPKTSIVLLVTDELSSVAAFATAVSSITETGELPKSFDGLLQGQGNARLRMNYLSPDAQIKEGDLVYTSPTSATFPPDILLGKVAKVHPLDPFLTFQSVEIQPALEASRLKEVMIVRQSAGTAERLAETARAALGAEPPPDESESKP